MQQEGQATAAEDGAFQAAYLRGAQEDISDGYGGPWGSEAQQGDHRALPTTPAHHVVYYDIGEDPIARLRKRTSQWMQRSRPTVGAPLQPIPSHRSRRKRRRHRGGGSSEEAVADPLLGAVSTDMQAGLLDLVTANRSHEAREALQQAKQAMAAAEAAAEAERNRFTTTETGTEEMRGAIYDDGAYAPPQPSKNKRDPKAVAEERAAIHADRLVWGCCRVAVPSLLL